MTATTSSTSSSSTCTDPVTNISVTISPATVSVNVATPQLFQDSIQGGTNNVTIWKVNGVISGNDTVGRIDSNGVYHAPSVVPTPNTVTVAAESFEDQNLSATSTVTVIPAPTVQISSPAPCTSSVSPPPSPFCITPATSGSANTVTFTATETGGSTNSVFWYVGTVGGLPGAGDPTTVGTINANGVYSPPYTPPIGQTVIVTAAAQDSVTSTASLAVTISGYSTSSLQGQFAFTVSGSNASGHFFRAGSFGADGQGHLDGVLEDVNSASGVTSTPISSTGSYTVSADGRGTLHFNDGLTPANFNFVLVNGTQLRIIGFDSTGTATGEADAQNITTFGASELNNTYVFDFSGAHNSSGISEIGEFTADGAGNIQQAAIDINDAGTLSSPAIFGSKTVCIPPPLTTPTPPPPSNYSVGANGRGTLTLNTYDPATCNAGVSYGFNFYLVDRGSAKFVSTDQVLQVAGYTSEQDPNATFALSSLNGSFAFLLAGSENTNPIATVGNFVADGNGNITSGVVDENVNGTSTAALALSANKYTVASNGRGTLKFATSARAYSLVFYLGTAGSNATAVVQDVDAGITSDGNFAQQQGGPFTVASVMGNYALQTSGASGLSLEDISGEIAADGTGKITAGKIDINTAGMLALGQSVTGSYSAPAATGRATLSLSPGASNYAAYVVSSRQVYILEIEPMGQLAAGSLLRLF